jgi:hypothetical protein
MLILDVNRHFIHKEERDEVIMTVVCSAMHGGAHAVLEVKATSSPQ